MLEELAEEFPHYSLMGLALVMTGNSTLICGFVCLCTMVDDIRCGLPKALALVEVLLTQTTLTTSPVSLLDFVL